MCGSTQKKSKASFAPFFEIDVELFMRTYIWLAVALAFALCSIGIVARQPWSLAVTTWVIVVSLALCVIGWPDSRIGVFVNVILLTVMLLGRRSGASLQMFGR